MAAGSEVPQKLGMNVVSGTSVYQPQSIAVPQGAGALWAGVGDTALKAAGQLNQTAQMLQQSPLNPAVKAQMQEAQDRAQMGKDYIDFVRKNPSYFQGTVGEGPGGATAVAPITQSVQQQSGWNIGPGGGGGTEPPKKEEKKTQPTQEEKKSPQPPADLNSGLSQAAPDSISNALASTLVPSQGGSTAAATAGDGGMPNTGQPQSPDVVATPAQPPAPQPSSIWSPGRPAPLAPPAPGPAQPPAQPAQPPAQSQTPAAATQADQASMAQWRTQNEHPVMSSQDALGWMKNFDTGVKRATYLPMGGPGGSPAFAFHMDGGGINTVPVSQMAQRGAGPLIASQNTSQVISSTDQQQGQQQAANQPNISPPPPANLPPAAPAGPQMAQANQPNISPPPPANLPSGPPPAPTGPQVAQAQPQYPNISGPPPAPAPGAYNPAPYRQGIAQATADPQNLMAQEQPQSGVRSTEGTGTGAQPVPTSASDVAAMNEESKSPTLLPYWKEDAAGNRYKELPDPQHPFWQQRFYPMTGGFQTGAWGDAENMRKQALFEEYSGTGGVPTGNDDKGKPIILDKDTIDNLSPSEQEAWIQRARDYKLHTNALLPSSPDGVNLANNANAVQAAQRIYDKLQYMKQNHIPMHTISLQEIIRSKEAGWAEATKDNPIEQLPWNVLGDGRPRNVFADALNGDYQQLNAALAGVQGGKYQHTSGTPKDEEWGIPATDWTPAVGVPRTTNVSKVPEINSISSGDTVDEAIGHIKGVLDNATKDYKNAAEKIPTANTRLPDVDRKNMVALSKDGKGYIDDPANKITWDAEHKKATNEYGDIPIKINPWTTNWTTDKHWSNWPEGKAEPTASPSPTAKPANAPTPVPREVADAAPHPQTIDDFNKIPKGVWYVDKDGTYKPKR